MAVCCCSLAGTAACNHCSQNPFATEVWTNTTVTTDHVAYTSMRKEKCKKLHDDMGTMLKELAEADFAYSEAFDIAKHAFKNQIEELGKEYLR